MNRVWFLAAITALAAVVCAYETGAPTDSCDNMKPEHGANPQTGDNPYSIKLSTNKIPSGGSVTVTLSGGDFKGFFVQARVGNKAIGHFDEVDNAKLVNCHGSVKNAITHSFKNIKRKMVLTWHAPKGLSENVVFWYTVVQEGKTYWVAYKSQGLTVGKH